MKYIVECMKKVKCIFVVDAMDDEECDKKLSAGQYDFKTEVTESRDDYLGCELMGHETFSGDGDGTVICSVGDLCKYLGTTPDRLKRDMYKYTECGMPISWDDEKVTLSAYAEGADGEPSHDLPFPFTGKDFDFLVKYVEDESDEIWHMWNDDDEADEEE